VGKAFFLRGKRKQWAKHGVVGTAEAQIRLVYINTGMNASKRVDVWTLKRKKKGCLKSGKGEWGKKPILKVNGEQQS